MQGVHINYLLTGWRQYYKEWFHRMDAEKRSTSHYLAVNATSTRYSWNWLVCVCWLIISHTAGLLLLCIVMHEAKCSVCKSFPIIGLRYRCLKCLNTDICQVWFTHCKIICLHQLVVISFNVMYNGKQWCFFTNKGTRIHKATHPTKEYCLPVCAHTVYLLLF